MLLSFSTNRYRVARKHFATAPWECAVFLSLRKRDAAALVYRGCQKGPAGLFLLFLYCLYHFAQFHIITSSSEIAVAQGNCIC